MTLTQDEAYDRIVRRIERQKSESTAEEYVRHIGKFREWMEVEGRGSVFDADSLDVEEHFEDMLDAGYAPSSVRVRKASLSAFYKLAIRYSEAGRLDVDVSINPTTAITFRDWTRMSKRSGKERATNEKVAYLKPDEVEKLARHVPSPTLRNELVIRLLFQTGMRRGELCRIRLTDIDRKTRQIKIHDKKSDSSRVVAYQPNLDLLMAEWVEVQRPAVGMAAESEYLFPTGRSLRLSGNRLNEMVRIAADRAGIQEAYGTDMNQNTRHQVTAHVLRHSFAMEAINQGWNIYLLKEAMGHHDISVTVDNYLHGDEAGVLEAFRLKGPGRTDTRDEGNDSRPNQAT